MSIDQQAVIAAYTSSRLTVPQVAAQFQLKPADVSAILRLNNVAIRKGNVHGANNLTPEARAKGHEARARKALVRIMTDLVSRHGYPAVSSVLEDIGDEIADMNWEAKIADDVAAQ
jgi:DNA-binding transcriptional regulator YbjK